MEVSRGVRWLLRAGSAITLAFLYAPLIVIAIYAFNKTRVQTWPPTGFTTSWFSKAFHNTGARDALWVSVKVGLGATAVAMLLGSLAAYALARFEFFGRFLQGQIARARDGRFDRRHDLFVAGLRQRF